MWVIKREPDGVFFQNVVDVFHMSVWEKELTENIWEEEARPEILGEKVLSVTFKEDQSDFFTAD